MSVLVTDGEQRSALAATRSLGRAGIRIIAAASRQPCLAGVSRYCATAVRCPPPESQPQAFAEAIAHAVEESRAQAIGQIRRLEERFSEREKHLVAELRQKDARVAELTAELADATAPDTDTTDDD